MAAIFYGVSDARGGQCFRELRADHSAAIRRRNAFGFSANTNGKYAVSIDTSINHIEALEEGDYIVASATLESLKNKVGFYIIEIKKGNILVALFKGVAFRTGKNWEE